MKILIVVDDFSDGAGNMAQILAKSLIDNGHEISMLLTYKHSNMRYDLGDTKVFDVNLSRLPGLKHLNLHKQILAAKDVIIKAKCECIISFLDNNNTIMCFAAKKLNIPIIVSERSNPVNIFPKFPWKYYRRMAYKYADVVSVQFDCFKCFDNNRFLEKCEVTHNIIEMPSQIKTNWSNDMVSFVSLTRYSDIKRLDLMIRMFLKIKSSHECELHIYGRGVNNKYLSDIIIGNKANNIFLHDAVDNVHEELIKHDIYLMTSLQEGFPNALSEALSVGLPAVVFKCHDGISELVNNGVNGFCVQEGNETQYIECMTKLADDCLLRKQYGKESIKIAGGFNKRNVMEEWYKCIEKAIQKKQNT